MIKLKTKQEIVLMHMHDGKSQREISRITGRDRKTIRKYIREYEEKRRFLVENGDADAEEIIDSIVEKPSYDSSSRQKKKLTKEVKNRIEFYLEENERRKSIGLHKQIRKKNQIHRALKKEGIDIGYTTVCQAISRMLNEGKEAFIRGIYGPGDICEFDWGEVKLWIDGTLMTLHMAAFCTARGNYRFGCLYTNEKTESFMESHAEFFSHIKGNHKTMVYDNMRAVVKKFVGRYEKEPTEALLKLSIYYCFQYRFCNTYSANEKGHVEKTVDYLRGEAFTDKLEFASIKDANEHLLQTCNEVNNEEKKALEGKTATQMLEEEREYLMPSLPPFDCAVTKNYRVNKYSTINVDGCFYSVPDNYVDKLVLAKVYTGKIIIFYEENKLAEHTKKLGFGKWSLDINHYLKTLKRKPGALTHSLALQQAHSRIIKLYEEYFTTNKRDFVELLLFMKEYDVSIDKIESAIERMLLINPTDISSDKIKFLCMNNDSNTEINDNRQDETYKNSREILELYGQLLSTKDDSISSEMGGLQ